MNIFETMTDVELQDHIETLREIRRERAEKKQMRGLVDNDAELEADLKEANSERMRRQEAGNATQP